MRRPEPWTASAAAVPPIRLGAFARLTKADADLNRLLTTLAQEQENADRLNRSFEQALFTAESRVRAVSEYIDTRRGSIGPEARTRLAEAKRQLQAAHDKKSTNLTEAIAYANAASALAANAQSLANADVQSAQRAYTRRGGNDTGAMLGGIIIGDLLSGGLRGGFGGWSPTSFGGSSSSIRGLIRAAASWAAAGGSNIRTRPVRQAATSKKMRTPTQGRRYPCEACTINGRGGRTGNAGAPPQTENFAEAYQPQLEPTALSVCAMLLPALWTFAPWRWPARRSPGSCDPTG